MAYVQNPINVTIDREATYVQPSPVRYIDGSEFDSTVKKSVDDYVATYSGGFATKTELAELKKHNDAIALEIDGYICPTINGIYNYYDEASHIYHRKIARVDLGSLAWQTTASSNSTFYSSSLTNYKTSDSVKALSATYTYVGTVWSGSQVTTDKTFALYYASGATTKYVYVRDTAYTDATAFKTAMAGKYLYYELATEETVQVLDDASIPWESFTTPIGRDIKVRKYGRTVEIFFWNDKASTKGQVLVTLPPQYRPYIPSYPNTVNVFDTYQKGILSISNDGTVKIEFANTAGAWNQFNATYLS